jgi:hypothetical protein
MQLGPGMPAAKRRRTPSAMPRARVTESAGDRGVWGALGSKPSIRRTTPVASPAPQQTPWIGSKPKRSDTRLL